MPVLELSYVLVTNDQPALGPGGQQQQQQHGGPPAVAAEVAPPPPPPAPPARYTRSLLRGTLQLMGQKPRQSDKAAQKVFLILQQRAALPPTEPLSLADRLASAPGGHAGVTLSRAEFDRLVMHCLEASVPAGNAAAAPLLSPVGSAGSAAEARQQQATAPTAQQQQRDAAPMSHGSQTGVAAGWQEQPGMQPAPRQQQQLQTQQQGLRGAQHGAQPPAPAAAAGGGGSPPLLADFRIACALREQRTSVAVLLCGTSGTGKSTLAALLAARLGISTVVSTDSIRHMMRSFSSEADDPLLWASTYQAGVTLQQLQAQAAAGGAAGAAVQQLMARYLPGAAAAGPGSSSSGGGSSGGGGGSGNGDARKSAVRGYKAQSARVLEHVDRLLAGCEARRQSVVVEGVHLSLSMVVRMMQRHPSVVPFLVHISNESKHMERFAVRSKVMTLRPDGNRYVKYFRNIRAIQDYLGKSADKHAIPKVDNTNVDRSVATIHTTVLGCLRRIAGGESVLSGSSLSCKLLLGEYLRCQSATWSSRDMLQLIRLKSAAAEAPSPTEDATSTATAATVPATTPRGPLSDGPGEELAKLGVGRGPAGVALRLGGGILEQAEAQGEEEEEEEGHQQGAAAAGAGEEEGDNRSFYGSDSNSDDSQEGDGSTSCSCSEEEEEEEERSAGRGMVCSPAGLAGSPRRQAGAQPTAAAGDAGGMAAHVGEGGDVPGPLGLPRRRRRHRDRLRMWRSGSGGSSQMGEIPAGPVPERLRRRSEVGSVLEPEPQSDTEDAELALAALAVHA